MMELIWIYLVNKEKSSTNQNMFYILDSSNPPFYFDRFLHYWHSFSQLRHLEWISNSLEGVP